MDHRLQNLSYSSLLTLHSCPRKYQLYKLQSTPDEEDPFSAKSTNVTFAYGHAVGTGIQLVLEGKSEEEVIWQTYLNWYPDLEDRNDKQNKNFYAAIIAIKRFIGLRNQGFLEGYELAIYNGNPATELGFCISFPDGFRYRGFVDAVLQHNITGKVLVLEIKTTSIKWLDAAMYKNSAQAIGYSIVLDAIFPTLSSYEVMYLPYMTHKGEYEPMPFNKSYLQRAQWIQELLLDVEMIKMYEAASIYPMHGESCFNFYRPCEYFGTCTLSTAHIASPEPTPAKEEFAVNLTIADLIKSQMSKTTQE